MERVEILHVDIAKQIPSIRFGTETLLVFFWWNDCPVGQIETFRTVGRHVDFEGLIASSVASDVIARAQGIVDVETSGLPAEVPPASVVICTRDRPEALVRGNGRCLGSGIRASGEPDEPPADPGACPRGRAVREP